MHKVNLNSLQNNAMSNQYGSLENYENVRLYCSCGYHAAKIIPVIDIKAIMLSLNYTALRTEEKLLVSNTVYKTLINFTVDFTPLRRHPWVNKDERTCTCTSVLPTYLFSQSSNKDAN